MFILILKYRKLRINIFFIQQKKLTKGTALYELFIFIYFFLLACMYLENSVIIHIRSQSGIWTEIQWNTSHSL